MIFKTVSPTFKKVVPRRSCFGSGKTHIAARAAVWSSVVHPPGTALTVTTATRARQVQRQMWPHIRQIVDRAGLPGEVGVSQWKMPDSHGSDVVVAYGSAPDHDESAVQGIHAPRLMFIVDEAGGIGRIIGAAMRGVLTGEHTRALLIGNPPTNDEGSWFEQTCADPAVHMLPISVYDTPLMLGERTRRCRSCPPQAPAHLLASHLVDPEWGQDAIRDHGEDAPFVQAKVHAQFPRGGQARAIPVSWIEAAEPHGEDFHALNALGLDGETSPYRVKAGAWVRLSVDVAAGGGNEMVIARVGDLVELRHATAGQDNRRPRRGRQRRAARDPGGPGSRGDARHPAPRPRHGVGVGWGVASLLTAWKREGLHDAEIVSGVVSEAPSRDDEAATLRPVTQRDERLVEEGLDAGGALEVGDQLLDRLGIAEGPAEGGGLLGGDGDTAVLDREGVADGAAALAAFHGLITEHELCPGGRPTTAPLTGRQLLVLRGWAAAQPNAALAVAMDVNPDSVRGYGRTVCAKLGASGRVHACALGVFDGLIRRADLRLDHVPETAPALWA
ncbi:DEAD/DEAH box helicase family protein [Kitasatospora sp. NPDC093550]|uniref:DEAD/DEAH box helicase family protein n=1 Tax=Kitasatospora sp. NPDC093550 TaxID=3364089 RepID=UPI003829B484